MFGEWSAPWIVAFWGIVGITLWAAIALAFMLLIVGAAWLDERRQLRQARHPVNLLPVTQRFEAARLRERARMQGRAS